MKLETENWKLGALLLCAVVCSTLTAQAITPVGMNITTNSVTIVPIREPYLDVAPEFSPSATYAQGSYISSTANGLTYMAGSTPLGTNAPSHSGGISNGWYAVPGNYRSAVEISVHSGGPVYLAYGSDAVPSAGTILSGPNSTATIHDYQGDIRAISTTNTHIGVAER